MSVKKQITLSLSPRAAELLYMVNDVYLKRGGPAYECAQEWDEAFTVEEIGELCQEIEQAYEPSTPAPSPV